MRIKHYTLFVLFIVCLGLTPMARAFASELSAPQHAISEASDKLQQKINDKLKLQKGYTIVYGGSFENMTAAKDRLSIVVPIALFLIFLFLTA